MDSDKEGRCYACGGRVDAHGMAEGGEVESESGEHEMGVNEDGESSQMQMADEAKRRGAHDFIAAVRRRRMR